MISLDRIIHPMRQRCCGAVSMRLVWLVAAAALVLVVVGAMALVGAGEGSDEQTAPTAEVQRGPLTIMVSEAGTIQNREKRIIKSEVAGSTTILWIIEEGTDVEVGDKLVELDSSTLEDDKIQQEIRVDTTEASFIRARETLAITRNQATSDVAQAELNLRFAKLDLEKYTDEEGEYAQQLQQALNDITIAEEEEKRALDRWQGSQKLAEKGYITTSELEADELAYKKRKLDREVAESKLKVLQRFTHERDKAKLESDVEQAEAALERARRKASADVVQAEADLRAKESEYIRQKDKLDWINEQIANCTITAPVSGMVVYATTGQGNRWRNQEPLDEGQQVRERQELIHLPTANEMMAEIKIHESAIKKVKVGMPVRIRCSALPGRTFMGRVAKIGLLPDAQMVWLNPDLKVYSTEVHLQDSGDELRPGMSCDADVIIAHYEEALYVPVQSVLKVNNQPTVYVQNARTVEPRPIEIGMDNNKAVHVLSGVAEGEKVLLAPPLAPSRIVDMGAQVSEELAQAANNVTKTPSADADKDKAVGGMASLSEEDQRTIGILQMIRQRDALDQLGFDQTTTARLRQMLEKLESGESVEIDTETLALARAKMQQMRNRQGQRPSGERGRVNRPERGS